MFKSFSAPVKAGKVLWMKVSYSEGLATHTGSESCMFGGNAVHEALTGVRTGQPLSREIEPPLHKRWLLLGADAVERSGRQNWKRRYRETLLGHARSKTLSMYASTLSGSREIPCLSVGEENTDRIGKSKDPTR